MEYILKFPYWHFIN